MLAALLCVVSAAALVGGGRAALVVSFDDANVVTKCVDYSGSASAADIIQNSGFGAVMLDDPMWGKALCKIGAVGCGTDNCFGCNSPYYWGFSYVEGGAWAHAPVGVGAYEVRDGDVIGFKYIDWNLSPPPQPPLYSFGSICQSQTTAQEGRGRIKHFSANVSGNCTNKTVNVSVTQDTGERVWAPSITRDLRVILGARIGVLHQDLWWVVEDVVYTDGEGDAQFVPRAPGKYEIEVEKSDYVPWSRTFYVSECKDEGAPDGKSSEEVTGRGNTAFGWSPVAEREKTDEEATAPLWVGFWIRGAQQ